MKKFRVGFLAFFLIVGFGANAISQTDTASTLLATLSLSDILSEGEEILDEKVHSMTTEKFDRKNPYEYGAAKFEKLCYWRPNHRETVNPKLSEKLARTHLEAQLWQCITHLAGTGAEPDGPVLIKVLGLYITEQPGVSDEPTIHVITWEVYN